ncbi:MAG: DJ-1/PfpI family protein [Deltaproteobacteria bacterium]|nr:DJ-1/PfpI family protein [Deltaproteobacteria bacterium]
MTKKVLVPIADGTEEIEAICIIDVLRRAGADVIVASVDELQIIASRGVRIIADKLITECIGETYDLIALPGGMPGAEHLRDSDVLIALLKQHIEQGRYYGAICASPVVVLQYHGFLQSQSATAHPQFAGQLDNPAAIESRVVVDGHCITSRGPGTAIEFALKSVEILYHEKKAGDIAMSMVV